MADDLASRLAALSAASQQDWTVNKYDKDADYLFAAALVTAYRAGKIGVVQPSATAAHGVTHCGVRDGGEEWHIECRMADGHKGAFVVVDKAYEELADWIAAALNGAQTEKGKVAKPTAWIVSRKDSNTVSHLTAREGWDVQVVLEEFIEEKKVDPQP